MANLSREFFEKLSSSASSLPVTEFTNLFSSGSPPELLN